MERPTILPRTMTQKRHGHFAVGHLSMLLGGIPLAIASNTAYGMQEAPASPDETASEGALRVTVAPDIVDAELLPGWIGQRNPELGPALELPGHEQWVAVDVGGATYDYTLTVTPMRDGQSVGAPPEPARCDCNHAELMDLADEKIATAVDVLRSTPVVERTEDVEPEPPPAAVTDTKRARPRLGPAGAAGIAMMATGVVGLGVGVSLVAIGDTASEPAYAWGSVSYKNLRPPGYAAIGVGAGLVAVGGVVFALRKRIGGKSNEQAMLLPALAEQGGLMVSATGRF